MKRTYPLGHRWMASVLLISLLLQSCYNPTSFTIPKGNPPIPVGTQKHLQELHPPVEESKDSNAPQTKTNVITQASQEVNFYQERGKWQAQVKEKIGTFSRCLVLPVYSEGNKFSTYIQPRDIHITLPEKSSNQQGYVYVGKLGLPGGTKGQKGKSEAKLSIDDQTKKNAFNQYNNPSYWYQGSDVGPIGQNLIMSLNNPTIVHVGALGRGVKQINSVGILSKNRAELQNNKSLVGIYNTGSNHWIAFRVYKSQQGIIAIYKDSLGGTRGDFEADIKKALGEGVKCVKFGGIEQKIGFESGTYTNCGVFALKNMMYLAKLDVEALAQIETNDGKVALAFFNGSDVGPIGQNLIMSLNDPTIVHVGALGRGVKQINSVGILSKNRAELQNNKSLVGIYNTGGNHWIAFRVFKSQQGIIAIYKDSLGGTSGDFEADIEKALGEEVKYVKFGGIEQKLRFEPGTYTNCGVFALKNMMYLAKLDAEKLAQIETNDGKVALAFFNPGDTKQKYGSTILKARMEFAIMYAKRICDQAKSELQAHDLRKKTEELHQAEVNWLSGCLATHGCKIEIETEQKINCSNDYHYRIECKAEDLKVVEGTLAKLVKGEINKENSDNKHILRFSPAQLLPGTYLARLKASCTDQYTVQMLGNVDPESLKKRFVDALDIQNLKMNRDLVEGVRTQTGIEISVEDGTQGKKGEEEKEEENDSNSDENKAQGIEEKFDIGEELSAVVGSQAQTNNGGERYIGNNQSVSWGTTSNPQASTPFELPTEPFEIKGLHDTYKAYPKINIQLRDQVFDQTSYWFDSPKGKTEINSIIGKGNSGTIYLAQGLTSERFFCIKIIHEKKEIEDSAKEGPRQMNLNGFSYMMALNDSFTAKLKGQQVLVHVMPLAGFGSVKKISKQLHQKDLPIRLGLTYHIAKGMMTCLEQIHKLHFYHLDLKVDNVVIDKRGKVLVIDLGCMKKSESGYFDRDCKGDLDCLSPERLRLRSGSSVKFSGAKADSWAVGVILLNLLVDGIDIDMDKHCKSPYLLFDSLGNKGLPQAWIDFLKGLLDPNEETRWNITEALKQLPWEPENLNDAINQLPYLVYTTPESEGGIPRSRIPILIPKSDSEPESKLPTDELQSLQTRYQNNLKQSHLQPKEMLNADSQNNLEKMQRFLKKYTSLPVLFVFIIVPVLIGVIVAFLGPNLNLNPNNNPDPYPKIPDPNTKIVQICNDYYGLQDYTKAIKCYQEIADQDHAEAQFHLGIMYEFGKGVQQNDEKAVECYQKSANQGHAEAQFKTGVMYANGDGVQQDNKKAVKWYQKSANQGHAEAQFHLGIMYEFGKGVQQNDEKAVEWYQKSANQGHAEAQFHLGIMYEFGKGIQQNDEKAVELYQKAVGQGHSEAQFHLGVMYANGKGVQQDNKKAVEWYQKAAGQGNAEAQFHLGIMYEFGMGIQQNDEKAVESYQKAAGQGHAGAQFHLGVMYANGKGVQQDNKKAVEWYQKSANQGNAEAQFHLGIMHEFGKGIQQNDEKAVEWYQKSANQGHAEAQFHLGVMYANGKGVQQDNKKAVEWIQKAAGQGNAEAQFELGVMYYYGHGVDQDYKNAVEWVQKVVDQYYYGQGYKKAVEWYQKAADQGHAMAQYSLGVMYANGVGVQRDSEKAVEWYQKAAKQGIAKAQLELGVMYYYGHGVDQGYKNAVEWVQKVVDQYYYGQGYKNAVKWFRKAADQGLVQAQFNLGVMYANGKGVQQNDEKAVEWFQKAADQGHAEAQFILGNRYYYGYGVDQDYKKAKEWYKKSANQGHFHANFNLLVWGRREQTNKD